MEYISSTDQKSLNERYMVTSVIVLLLTFSSLTLLLIPTIVHVERKIVVAVNWTMLLYTAALLIGITVVLIRRVLLSKVMLAGAARIGTGALLTRLSMASLICAVLGELVGVLSLVGYLSTGESFAWPVGFISVLLLAYSFPRKGEWVRALANVEAAARG